MEELPLNHISVNGSNFSNIAIFLNHTYLMPASSAAEDNLIEAVYMLAGR